MERNILEAPLRVLNNYVVIANSWGWIVCVQGHGLAEDADGGGGEEGGGGGEHDAGQGLRAEQGRAEAGAVVRRPAPVAVDGERAGGVAGPPVRAQRQVQRRTAAARGAVRGVDERFQVSELARVAVTAAEQGAASVVASSPTRPRRRVGVRRRGRRRQGSLRRRRHDQGEGGEGRGGGARRRRPGDVAHARVQVDAPASPAHAAREQPDGHYKNKMM